jgi:hypothetical protein
MQGRIIQKIKVYKGWKNAHHIQNIAVNKLEDGIINLEADIIYQNLSQTVLMTVILCITAHFKGSSWCTFT